MEQIHIPVLLNEVLSVMNPQPGESYLDLTAGYGGHAEKILGITQNYNDAVLVDRDDNATNFLNAKYQEVKPKIVQKSFYEAALSEVKNGNKFDLILADLGVSSPQLDVSDRGFSLNKDARLDMRMDRRQELDAWKVVNKYSVKDLTKIFVEYGEERPGRAEFLAKEIAVRRPINTTGELAEIIKAHSGFAKTHPATKIFQAIRMEVNDELGQIAKTLELIPQLLGRDGRVAIISFHSLEDRLVKESFRAASSLGHESSLKIITKKPIVAGKTEIANNPRARSAKLRAAVKL